MKIISQTHRIVELAYRVPRFSHKKIKIDESRMGFDFPAFLKLNFSGIPNHEKNFFVTAKIPLETPYTLSSVIKFALECQIESIIDPWDLLQYPDSATIVFQEFWSAKFESYINVENSLHLEVSEQYFHAYNLQNMKVRRNRFLKSLVKTQTTKRRKK